MPEAGQLFFPSTSTEHAAWIVAVTITFLVYVITGVVAKLLYRRRHLAMKSYDKFVVASLLVAVAQSILIVRACVNGLGRHEIALSDSALETVRKELFAASLLSAIVHTFAKISVTLFINAIKTTRELKLACYALLAVIVAWGLSSIFLLAFRCESSAPWSRNQATCLDEFRVYLGINLGNIITDIPLIVLPAIMMWNVQTSVHVKARVVALFASRLLVPAIIITQTAYLTGPVDDETWSLVEPTILAQVAMSLSILTACVPSLKGVVDVFWSGASQFVVPSAYTSSHNKSSSHGIRSLIPSQFRSAISATHTSRDKSQLRSQDMKESHLRSKERSGHTHTNLERSESQTNLRGNHINRTTEYEVCYEPAEHPNSKTDSDDVSQISTDAYAHGIRPSRSLGADQVNGDGPVGILYS